jgi:hypothetical protein
MRRAPSSPPLWFLCLVAVALGVLVRVCLPEHSVATATGPEHGAPRVAFLQFLILIGSLIWKGLEVAGRVTLQVLHWMVIALHATVAALANGLKALGSGLLKGLKRTWDFTRRLYDDVLKPAWKKFWGWFDKFRKWLDHTFGPILKWLKHVRDAYLCFYKTWIKPWLDLIDITRKTLRVLAALHVSWARAVEARLARLEELIEKPFRLVLAKINEIINLVNRVATLDGLLQRVALIRSLERDYIFAWRAATNPWHRLFSGDEESEIKRQQAGTPHETIIANAKAYMRDKSGPDAPLINEMTIIWRRYLVRR